MSTSSGGSERTWLACGMGGIVGSPSIRFDICGGALVVLIGATLFLELATQWVHARFADDKASLEMVQKLEMELMILGFLSFSLVMSNEYSLPWISSSSWFHAFEFAHILLFYAVCFLMLRAVIMRRALRQLVKNMDRLEREDIRETLDKFIASTEQEQGLVTRIRRGVFGSPHSDPRWDLAWQIMRKVVPRKPRFRDHHRTQDVDDDFDFARYCELILQRDILHSVHISGPIWAVVGLIGFVITLSSLDYDNPMDTSGAGPMGSHVPVAPPAQGTSACNTALPVSNNFEPPFVPGAAAAVFGEGPATNLVSGVVTFTQEAGGAVLAIDLHWDDTQPDVGVGQLAWHIHEKPVSGDCGSTGGHYIPECTTAADTCPASGVDCPSTALSDRAGELSARIGNLCDGLSTCLSAADRQLFTSVGGCTQDGCLTSNGGVTGNPTQRQIVRLPADGVIQLSGQNTVIGRSIVIHSATAPTRIACATIQPAADACAVPPPTGQEAAFAVAVFTDEVGGQPLQFDLQFAEADSTGGAGGSHTIITLSMAAVGATTNGLPASADGYAWHVHVGPRGDGTDTAVACGAAATGGHYDPECFGSSSPAGIGELKHRHGPLTPDMVDGTTWIDSHLPLRGDNSIVGRSIVIHDATGARVACATIEVPPQGRRHLAGNVSSAELQDRSPRVAAETSIIGAGTRDFRRMPRAEMSGVLGMRRRLVAGSDLSLMPVEEAWGIVLVIILFCWVTTVLLHVILHIQHVKLAKLLKNRGWHSDDADVLRTCVDELVAATQLRDTIVEIERIEAHADDRDGGHGHANDGLCALSGYNAKEKLFNFVTDTLICLNCFYSGFCVLYGLYATGWTDAGWAGAFLLNIFLFVPAAYQFLALGPSITRDRAMLTAYIHLDEELIREVEVYTARTLEIKASLCESVLQHLDGGSSALTDDERAQKAADFFFDAHTGVDKNADGALCPDELETAIAALRMRVTHSEIKQLMRELDKDQSGSIGRQELEDFLAVSMTQKAIVVNKAAAKSQLGFRNPRAGGKVEDSSAETRQLVERLTAELKRSRQLEAELRQAKEEGSRVNRSLAGGSEDPRVLAEMQALAAQVQQLQEEKSRLTRQVQGMHAGSAGGGVDVADSRAKRSPPPSLSTLSHAVSHLSHTSPRAAKRPPPPLPAKSVVFNQYDKDSSGLLEASEVRALLRARGISPAAVDQILAKYDQNGDGALSQEEFDGLYAQLAAQTQRGAPRAGSRRQVAATPRGAASSI